MPIIAGQQALASDFISTSAGASSVGQVPKLNSIGKLDNSFLPIKFGGTGADGALSISSGTTNIDCANSEVVIKNYSSISITGTGKLTFTNPHANGTVNISKSVGNVTLTSSQAPMIDCSGMGGQAGNSGRGLFLQANAGGGGVGGGNSNEPGGAGGGNYSGLCKLTVMSAKSALICGAGGASGGTYGGSGGSGGGAGGGALYIECGGALNFTTASGISVAGKNGSNTGNSQGGAGGGGGGGACIILYNTLTANSGTVIINGGNGGVAYNGTLTGGSGGNGTGGTGNGGSGGGGQTNYGGSGGGGGASGGFEAANGVGGGLQTNYCGSGGGGASGYSLIALNTEFS